MKKMNKPDSTVFVNSSCYCSEHPVKCEMRVYAVGKFRIYYVLVCMKCRHSRDGEMTLAQFHKILNVGKVD